MREVTDECVGCTSMGMPCIGDSCRNKHVTHYYCDRCKKEFYPQELYVNEDNEELCAECILSEYPTVEEKESEE